MVGPLIYLVCWSVLPAYVAPFLFLLTSWTNTLTASWSSSGNSREGGRETTSGLPLANSAGDIRVVAPIPSTVNDRTAYYISSDLII